jgi:hypothetical protein
MTVRITPLRWKIYNMGDDFQNDGDLMKNRDFLNILISNTHQCLEHFSLN